MNKLVAAWVMATGLAGVAHAGGSGIEVTVDPGGPLHAVDTGIEVDMDGDRGYLVGPVQKRRLSVGAGAGLQKRRKIVTRNDLLIDPDLEVHTFDHDDGLPDAWVDVEIDNALPYIHDRSILPAVGPSSIPYEGRVNWHRKPSGRCQMYLETSCGKKMHIAPTRKAQELTGHRGEKVRLIARRINGGKNLEVHGYELVKHREDSINPLAPYNRWR